jgi:hypothetical protein
MVEPASIISIILICGLVVERILKHFKKSSCCGNEMEFSENASAPDLQSILRK